MNWNDIFNYHAGILYWKIAIGRKIKANSVAGNISKSTGYTCIKYKGINYKAQNIIWEMHNGPIPKGYVVDHNNHRRSDNDLDNLNLILKKDNHKNKVICKNNSSGFMGVSWDNRRNKWMAYIGGGKNRKHIGYFDEKQDAIAARLSYEKQLGYNPMHNTRLS